jgi:hypothetical protein
VGNLTDTKYINDVVGILYGIAVITYIIVLYIRKRKNIKKENAPIMAISLYGLVILGASLVSLVIKKSIIYPRYFLVITPMFIFFLAYTMANYGNKYFNTVIGITAMIIAICVNINLMKINYDSSNKEPFNYIASEIKNDDIILYGNEGSGFVIATNYPDNQSYFWDQQNWHTEEAFKAFGKDMQTIYNLDALKDYHGRIWIINATNYAILDSMKQQYEINLIMQKGFSTKYKNFQYTISLVEK